MILSDCILYNLSTDIQTTEELGIAIIFGGIGLRDWKVHNMGESQRRLRCGDHYQSSALCPISLRAPFT